MRPLFHAPLVNGRFDDPALYVETQFEARAALFDLGDIATLPPRKILKIEHVFVSHMHIDHFIGFDHLLRLNVGREKEINLYGPQGFIDCVDHKLQAYCWNLADRYECDLLLRVKEIATTLEWRRTLFRLKTAFAREEMGAGRTENGITLNEPTFQVSATLLEHPTPLPRLRTQGGRSSQCLEDPTGGPALSPTSTPTTTSRRWEVRLA